MTRDRKQYGLLAQLHPAGSAYALFDGAIFLDTIIFYAICSLLKCMASCSIIRSFVYSPIKLSTSVVIKSVAGKSFPSDYLIHIASYKSFYYR